ncbi:Glycosyltransferase 29 (sialyltransferase) [Branchiostoma belcheri]|nr:Glycosyltransferase 29 (sialyltransferase) [Branchiostoma belcheri]
MKPPLTTSTSFQSHARAQRKDSGSGGGGRATFVYRHPLLCLCLLLLVEDVLWLGWLYYSESQCDCPEMAEVKKDVKKLAPLRRKMPKYKPNKKAYQDLLQQVADPSLLEKLPDLDFNMARIELIRKQIWQRTQIQDYLYASKKTMPLGSVIPFFEGRNKSTYYMIPDVYNFLPEEVLWPDTLYENCSVVGNGGILLNSSCGPDIDSSQYVLRNNVPPLTMELFSKASGNNIKASVDYYEDVGTKANFISMNPSGLKEL